MCSIVASIACAACATEPVAPDRFVRVTVQGSANAFRVGDTVLVRVIAANLGSETVLVKHTFCRQDYDVLLGADTVHSPVYRVCATIGMPIRELAPGAADTVSYPWTGMVHPNYVTQPVALHPGQYELRGRAIVNGLLVESERVPLRILP